LEPLADGSDFLFDQDRVRQQREDFVEQ